LKRKILTLCLLTLLSLSLISCNRQIIDTTWKFNKAIILLGDETIEIEIDSWMDYDEDTSIQIKAKDGTSYLTDLKNVILISE
jgi:hypothetical protein